MPAGPQAPCQRERDEALQLSGQSSPEGGLSRAAQTAMPMLQWGDCAGPHGASVQNKAPTSPRLSPLTEPDEPLASTGRHSALSLKCTQISLMSQPTAPARDTCSGQDTHDPAEPRRTTAPRPSAPAALGPTGKDGTCHHASQGSLGHDLAQEVLKPVSSEVSTAGKPSFAAPATPEGLGDTLLLEHPVGKGGRHAACLRKGGTDSP